MQPIAASVIPDPDERDDIPSPLTLDLDWDVYFDKFKEAHGEPVVHHDRLLFADGWTYNARSKEGPEYPPPRIESELHQLQTTYWLIRLRLVETEYYALRDIIQGLRELQRTRSLPLQQTSITLDEESGRMRRVASPVNIDELEQGRLAWLADDIVSCRQHLKSLNTP